MMERNNGLNFAERKAQAEETLTTGLERRIEQLESRASNAERILDTKTVEEAMAVIRKAIENQTVNVGGHMYSNGASLYGNLDLGFNGTIISVPLNIHNNLITYMINALAQDPNFAHAIKNVLKSAL